MQAAAAYQEICKLWVRRQCECRTGGGGEAAGEGLPTAAGGHSLVGNVSRGEYGDLKEVVSLLLSQYFLPVTAGVRPKITLVL